jgi:hypothetical protein
MKRWDVKHQGMNTFREDIADERDVMNRWRELFRGNGMTHDTSASLWRFYRFRVAHNSQMSASRFERILAPISEVAIVIEPPEPPSNSRVTQ